MQRAEVTYDPVQTEVMNDRIIAPSTARSSSRRSRAQAIRTPRRSSSWACRAPARRCSSRSWRAIRRSKARASSPMSAALATSLNRNRERRHQLSRGGARTGARERRRARQRVPRSCAHASAARRAALHRQDAEQLSERRPHRAMLPNAKIIDARRHPLDACLSYYRQLFAKGQNFTYDLTEIGEYYLQYQRMMDHWHRVLPGPRTHRAVRGGGRGLRAAGAAPARFLRPALAGRLPAILRERAARADSVSRAGPPADLRPLRRALAALRAPPGRADRRDRADPRPLPALRGRGARGRRGRAAAGSRPAAGNRR